MSSLISIIDETEVMRWGTHRLKDTEFVPGHIEYYLPVTGFIVSAI